MLLRIHRLALEYDWPEPVVAAVHCNIRNLNPVVKKMPDSVRHCKHEDLKTPLR